MENPQTKQITVPSTFCRSPFYNKGDQITGEMKGTFKDTPLFFYDILNQVNPHDFDYPWENPQGTQEILETWKNLEESLSNYFRVRDKNQVKPLMRMGLGSFIELIFWSHGKPVVQLTDLTNALPFLSFLPVNLEERLSFILDEPYHHLSFIQLSELFNEHQKKMALIRISKNKSSQGQQ